MAAGVERDGGDAAGRHAGLVDVPGVEGGGGGDIGRGVAQGGGDLAVQRVVVAAVVGVEGLGPLGQDHVAAGGVGGGGDPAAVAPDPGGAARGRAVGAGLVVAGLGPQAAVGVAGRLALRVVPRAHVRLGVVLLHPGVDVLDIHRRRLAQGGGDPQQGPNGGAQQRLEDGRVARLVLVAQPAVAGHGARHVEAVGLGAVGDRAEAQLQDQQGMGHEEGSQGGRGGQPRADLHQLCLHVGRRRVRRRAGPGAHRVALGHLGPVQQGEERAVARHDGSASRRAADPAGPQRIETGRRNGGHGYHDGGLLGRVGA